MNNFSHGIRVVVSEPGHIRKGLTGQVVRQRMCDDGAWVEMDARPDDSHSAFPFPVDDTRSNHTLLYPEQCEKA
jgi:hypothetical protein